MNNQPRESKTRLAALVCQTKLAVAAKNKWLASLLLRQLHQIVAQIVRRFKLGRAPRRLLVSTVAGATLIGATFGAMPVYADSIVVSAAAGDVIDANGGDCAGLTVAMLPGPDGRISLREAICAANTNPGVDTITLPSETILLTLTGADEDSAATGDLDVDSQIVINGQGLSQSIIDGNDSDRIFHVLPGAILNLTDMTIQGGRVISDSGGGILIENGDLGLTNLLVTDNVAERIPSGRRPSIGEPPTAQLTEPSFGRSGFSGSNQRRQRTFVDPQGDQTSMRNKIQFTVSPNVADFIRKNEAFQKDFLQNAELRNGDSVQSQALVDPPFIGMGGGIFNLAIVDSSRMTMTNSIVTGNIADFGGGLGNGTAYGNAEILITSSSVISNNFAAYSGGGAFNTSYISGSSQLTVQDSTIQANYAVGYNGGGVYNSALGPGQSTLQVVNSTISGNRVTGSGGGILSNGLYGGSATTQLSNSTVSNNTAYGYGSGIANTAVFGSNAQLEITNNSTISGNTNVTAGGGIMNETYVYSSTAMTVTDSTISGNSALFGGGIYNYNYYQSTQDHTVTNSTISGNTTQYGGAGIGNWSIFSGTLSMAINNSVISDNQASATYAYGGGVDIFSYASSATIALDKTTVSRNEAGYGGGISNYGVNGPSVVTVSNSTISGNSATQNGGGIENGSTTEEGEGGGGGEFAATSALSSTITINHSTITNNTADSDNDGAGDGGGIYSTDPMTVTNSIVAGNFDTPNNAGPGNIHPDAHNLVMGNATNLVGNTDGISGTLGSGSDIVTDTLGLGPLADNGGTNTASGLPPFTHALLDDSPAIDAADSAACTAAPITSVDQRGQPRPGANTPACDIGAYEFQAPAEISYVYMPLVFKNYTLAPDLIIESLSVGSNGPTVTIRNVGNGSVTNAFWLDVYFNPSQIPGLNQEWDFFSEAGAAWGVTKDLAPGEALTLTVGDAYYDVGESSDSFPANAVVYGFVDSVHYETNFGNVPESHEDNNLFGPVTSSASAVSVPDISSESTSADDELPERK